MTSAWALLGLPLPLSAVVVESLPKPVYTSVASAVDSVASPVATAVAVDEATVLVVEIFTLVGS